MPIVTHDLDQLARVDVVEKAEHVHMSWYTRAGTNQGNVVVERGFVVRDADAAAVVLRGDIDAMLMLERAEHAVGGERRRATVGVMDHDDVLEAEQVLHRRYRLQPGDGTSTRYRHGEQRARVPYFV